MPHECTDCGRLFEDGSKEMLSGCPDCGATKFQFHVEAPDGDHDPAEAPEPPEPPEPPVSSSVARTVGKTAATVRDLVSSDGPPEDVGGPALDREDSAQASARSEVVGADELAVGASPEPETEHRFEPVRPPVGDGSDGDGNDGSDASVDRIGESDAGVDRMGESADAADRIDESDDVGDSDVADAAGPDDRPTRDAPATEARRSREPGCEAEDTTKNASVSYRPDLEQLRAELNDQFESIKVVSPGQYELNLMELYDREEYIVALEEDGKYSIQVPENFRQDD